MAAQIRRTCNTVSKCFTPLTASFHTENCLFHYGLNPLVNCGLIKRYYSRKMTRTPKKVILPDEDSDSIADARQTLHLKPKLRPQPLHTFKSDSQTYYTTFNEDVGLKSEIPHYIKLGDNTSVFTQAMTIAKSRKMRQKNGKIVLEGRRLIKDALDVGYQPDMIFFSLEENLKELPLSKVPNLKLYKVMYKQLQIWSDLVTCPGIMGIFKMPSSDESLGQENLKRIPLTVICDNIREPNNLGAIMRCVAAAGCQRILLMKGCVDVWEPKVLRSGAGAHFHIKIVNNIEWAFISNYVAEDAIVYVAENNISTNENVVDDQELPSSDTFDDDDQELSASDTLGDDQQLPSSDNIDDKWYEVTEDGKKYKPAYHDRKSLKKTQSYSLDTLLYHQMRIDPNRETVLVVGGETHGLSDACRRFAVCKQGSKLVIPLDNNVESLNSSVAAGIIIFNILRQLKNN